MKVLIAVLTCHRFRSRADAVRVTWGKQLSGSRPPSINSRHDVDLRFFLGGGTAERDDEVILNCGDAYLDLPHKLRAVCQWARAQGYDYIYKSDDDAYVVPGRLLASGFEKHDYCGRLRGPSGNFSAPYCSGFGYWLSARAASILADARPNGDTAEDRYVANTLLASGVQPQHDPRYVVLASEKHSRNSKEPPRKGNAIIAACEFAPAAMWKIHQEFLAGVPSEIKPHKAPSGNLADVDILIKTFLRDGYLFKCLAGLEKNFPECRLVVVDDGFESNEKITLYSALRERGHACVWLPFDSGFGAKANEGLRQCERKYVLIGSDDFDFAPEDAREGVEKLRAVLEHDKTMAIASGRLNARPYESCLSVGDRSVREVAGHREVRQHGGIVYRVCDLTVNFSLIRRTALRQIFWDENVKIGGGEHGAFFLDAKRAGLGVCVVDGVLIREVPFTFSLMHPSYPHYRKRARDPGRACLKRRGIDHWILQNGLSETT
jgi:hypothetical protein